MSKNLLNDEFFIIDSDNLESIKQLLYGYILQDKNILEEEETDINNINPNGTYIYVKVDDTEIKLLQDFNGSYGLYLYKSDDYFAISNSFLKLVEYLKDKHPISFNKDYADAFLFASLCSFAYGETLVNEIEVLPRNYKVIINKKDKSINFEEIDYGEHTIDLDSKEGFEILDNWYYKWINIIRSIKEKTNNLSIHLSGGFDSRVTAALMLSANIDLNKINVFSSDDGLHTHTEDYEIASEIAKEFNFELNKDVFSAELEVFDDVKTPLEISFYTKLGFHKQMYFKYFRYSEPVYSINGSGGEYIRGATGNYKNSSEEFISNYMNKVKRYHKQLSYPTERVAKRGLDKLSKRYPNIKSEELPETLYREVRGRNHFGKGAVEGYFQNMISLSPAIDSELNKLKLTTSECDDKFLLMATIFSRYCPKLLDFKFDSERKIKEETIEYAKKLNKKYEFNKKEQEFISGPELKISNKEINTKNINVERILKKHFYSKSFEMEFKKYYPSELYDKISDNVEIKDYYPLTEVYSSIGILKILEYVKFNNLTRHNIENWIDEISNEDEDEDKRLKAITKQLLTKYKTSRIDLQNSGGKDNTIEVLNSNYESKIKFADWVKDNNGKVFVVEGIDGKLDLKIKCIKDGKLNLILRGPYIKDKENNRFPVYIDYKSLLINNVEQLEESQLVSHEEKYTFEKDVKDGEIVEIYTEWKPFNNSSIFKNTKFNKLKEKNLKLKEKNLKLEEKNSKLKEKNKNLQQKQEEILNSNSWKMTQPLRKVGKLIK